MNICAQGLSQLLAADVGNRMQCQTVVELIVVQQVLSDTVDDQVEELVFFV